MPEVLLIMLVLAISCSMVGNILVITNQSMLADALSHSVLLGIVLGFFLVRDLNSPLLMIGASVFGVLTIVLIDRIHSQKVAHDAATGLVFTCFFALGVMLISLFARNVHLDLDMVLMGEVLFAPFVRMDLFGLSLPLALVKGLIFLLVISTFYLLFFRHLSLFLFDQTQARLAGVKVSLLMVSLMFLTSLSIVTAFDSLGSITVISFLVAPAMLASLVTRRFVWFSVLSSLFAVAIASIGYYISMGLDVTVSGVTALVALITFLIALAFKNLLGLRRS